MDEAQSLAGPVAEIDEDLAAARAAVADPGAFAPIYQRHRLTVYRYARSRTSSDDAALEVTAQTFERALRSIEGFRPRGGGMAAWLLRIARNVAIDEGRRAARAGAGGDAVAASGQSADPVRIDELTELRAMVASLPERQRDAVALRYAAGLTAREIGAVLGMSEDAAQKQLERALGTLREAYRDA